MRGGGISLNGSRTYEVAEFKCYLIRSDLGRVNAMKRAVCPRVIRDEHERVQMNEVSEELKRVI